MGKKPLLVLGFGGNAVDAVDTIETQYQIVAFVDDHPGRQSESFTGIPVRPRSALTDYPDVKVLSLIGSEKTFRKRKDIIDSFNIPPSRFATVVHPKATVSRFATIGHDVIIFPGVVIPSDASLGNHIFVLPNSVIHHGVVIDDYVIIGANVVIAGNVTVEQNCYLGSGSTIKNGIKLSAQSLVGMSANIVKNSDKESILIGNPARKLNVQ